MTQYMDICQLFEIVYVFLYFFTRNVDSIFAFPYVVINTPLQKDYFV